VVRQAIHVVACLLMLAGNGRAQEWAKKMFEKTSFDFGTIARGTKAVHAFPLKNIYEETVHIAGVRSTCGCTTIKITRPTLKTFEKGEILAEFNTVAFRGPHSSTLTVVIDKPFPGEVQLQVYGNIRTDVVIDPGAIEFGSVNQGMTATKKITIRHAGRNDWRIVDVRSANPEFEVEIGEVQRGTGRVTYELNVDLKKTMPAGYINDQLILVTNDPRSPRIPVHVQGRVVPEISVSPRSLILGEVRSGGQVIKKLVVRSNSKRPFRIVDVRCEDACFSFESNGDPKPLHLVTVSFHAPAKAGEVNKTIHIETDPDRGDVELVAHATVVP
jgi:hypothetical protein